SRATPTRRNGSLGARKSRSIAGKRRKPPQRLQRRRRPFSSPRRSRRSAPVRGKTRARKKRSKKRNSAFRLRTHGARLPEVANRRIALLRVLPPTPRSFPRRVAAPAARRKLPTGRPRHRLLAQQRPGDCPPPCSRTDDAA